MFDGIGVGETRKEPKVVGCSEVLHGVGEGGGLNGEEVSVIQIFYFICSLFHSILCLCFRSKINELNMEIGRLSKEIGNASEENSSYLAYEKRYVIRGNVSDTLIFVALDCLSLSSDNIYQTFTYNCCLYSWNIL